MTREEAIQYNKNLKEYMSITDKKSEYKFLEENYIALDMAIKALEQTRWIYVKDRLPEPNRLVLCYITTGSTETYITALWNDIQNAWEEGIGGCRLLENDLGYKVMAWIPLPQSYKPTDTERSGKACIMSK